MSNLETAIKIGQWLESHNYAGPDVCSSRSQLCSTSLAFSVRGWLNLYRYIKDDDFLRKAHRCADLILALQKPDGSWPFPWPFRGNPENFSFACETMFAALALLEFYLYARSRTYLDAVLRAKRFLMTVNGYFQLAKDSYCLWYSSANKVRIPNLGAIAGHLFSKLYLATGNAEDLHLATAFTNYCISAQRPDGSSLYWFPPLDLSLQPGEDYSHDLRSRGREPLDLHRFCYVPYHSLTIFEVEEAYRVVKSELYYWYFTRAAEFLASIVGNDGSLPEMVIRKEWEAKGMGNSVRLYTPGNLARMAYDVIMGKLYGSALTCTAKNVAWTAKAFLSVSRYEPRFSSLAGKMLDYLVNNFVDARDGTVMYKPYPPTSALKSRKFARGTSIVFESITSCLVMTSPAVAEVNPTNSK